MQVLILAAGYGTRLYPLIVDTPKPLLEVNGKPIIEHVLSKLENLEDVSQAIVVTNNKFYTNFENWARQPHPYKFKLKIVNDGTNTPDDRLGSIGDIDFVLKQGVVKEDLLVVGGDNLFDFDIEKYLHLARQKKPAATIGVYDIGDNKEASKFGVVHLAKDNRINSFEEKPEHSKSSLIAMCFYYFPKESLRLVGEYLASSEKSDKAGDYIKWLCSKSGVYGFQFQGKWYDIGSIESYEQAQEAFK